VGSAKQLTSANRTPEDQPSNMNQLHDNMDMEDDLDEDQDEISKHELVRASIDAISCGGIQPDQSAALRNSGGVSSREEIESPGGRVYT
jgi:hypothetical protein